MTPTEPSESSPGDLAALLAMTFRVLTDRVRTALAADGYADLRPAHGFTFQYLSHHPEATAVELAAHLGVTKQAAVQLLDELTRRGYVRRGAHGRDRRSRVLELTEQGWACIRRAVQLWEAEERHWAAAVGPQRLAALRADLITYLQVSTDGTPVGLRPLW